MSSDPRPPPVCAVRVLTRVVASLIALLGLRPQSVAASGPVVNGRDFPTIQKALDSLPRDGGTVMLPAGVYDVHEKLRLRSHVELRGEGIDRTILVLADGVRDHLISNADVTRGNTDITIRDLQLQGNREGQRVWAFDQRLALGRPVGKDEVWSFGVRFTNVTDSLIQNVEADNFVKDGFYLGYNRLSGVYRTRIVGCRAFENGRNGISLTHGSYNVIDGCVVDHNNLVEEVSGIDLEPDEELEVSHNRVVNNRVARNHNGISLYVPPPRWQEHPVLTGNAVCQNRAEANRFVGIWDHFGQGNTFVGNTAEGSEHDFGPAATSRVGEEYASLCNAP